MKEKKRGHKMRISYFDNYESMSAGAAQVLVDDLNKKKNLLVCTATGASPLGLYQRLAKVYPEKPGLFEGMRILKLDEWGGTPMTDPDSCQSYIRENILAPLKISGERYTAFNSQVDNVADDCKRIQQRIDEIGPIDLCILGLGKNGHLGFNEPSSSYLHRDCHIAKLAESTVQHNMVQSMSKIPTFGMTVGMKDILNSKKIMLLITGSGKKDAITWLMKKEITTQLPASFLWLHENVECLVDRTSL